MGSHNLVPDVVGCFNQCCDAHSLLHVPGLVEIGAATLPSKASQVRGARAGRSLNPLPIAKPPGRGPAGRQSRAALHDTPPPHGNAQSVGDDMWTPVFARFPENYTRFRKI